jgi:hypothetical protein
MQDGVMHTHDEETRKFFRHSGVYCVLVPRYASNKLSIFKQQVRVPTQCSAKINCLANCYCTYLPTMFQHLLYTLANVEFFPPGCWNFIYTSSEMCNS